MGGSGTDTGRALIAEMTVRAPRDVVWRALRDPAEIRRWHGWDTDDLDDEIHDIYETCAVASDADGTIAILDVGTEIAIEPRGSSTVLRVTRTPSRESAPWDAAYDPMDEGWISFFQQLRFALEHHPGEDRRALHFDGNARPGSGSLTAARLGLALGGLAAGDAYRGSTAWGERLSGRLWFTSENQVGVTVDSYGDGLVILHAKPEAARPPHGGGKAIVTTYGLGDRALREIELRWAGWWAGHFA